MKKILCLILLIATLCTVYTPMYTPVYADNDLSEAIEYLSAVGIAFEYEEETIQPDQRVTRATFAQAISKLFKLSDIECSDVYYHDVSTDHWAFNNIGVLTEQKILSGNGGKYFYPDEYISREEVATIVVSALGYRAYAENMGGYAEGYIKVANELELFKNCGTDSAITLSDVLIMLRNAVDANVSAAIFRENEIQYTQLEDETVLSYYHDMYYSKGTLTGCDGITIESTAPIKDGIVVIDGIEYESELEGMLDMIGTDVEFLYKADEADSDERQLVWVKSLGRNDFIDIHKDENCRFDSDNFIFRYMPEGMEREKKINISEGLIVIYNGAITTENVADILNQDKYDVRFIESKGSSDYDIAIIWKYDNIVVGKVDFYEEVIYDKFSQKKTLDISNKRENIVIQGGKTLDQIENGDVLSYYESKDGTSLTIEISKNAFDVTAQWIREDDGNKLLVTDNGDYIFYDSSITDTVLYGEKVRVYLDINGYIAAIEKVNVDGFPAYLIKVSYDDGDDILSLKTLDYDGKIEKRQVAKKAKLDGTKMEFDVMYSLLTVDNGTKQQVVVLKLDEEGLIKAIDTVEVGDKELGNSSLRCYEKSHRGQYKHHGRLVPKYLISPSTVIFSVPSKASDDDRDFLVKSKSDLSNDQWYTFDIYRYSKGAIGAEELVVIKDKQWGLTGRCSKIYVLVDEIVSVINEDEEPVEEMTFNREGNSMKAVTTSDFSLLNKGVKSGDLALIATNRRGEIYDAEIKYSYGSGDRPINNAYNAEPGLRVAYAHEKVGNVLRIGYDSGADYDEIFEMWGDRIVVYDADAEEKIRKGSMWDILTFKDVGNACTTVVIQTIDESPSFTVVYK